MSDGLFNPMRTMRIRFDGPTPAAGGLRTLNGARFGMTRNNGARAHQGVDLDCLPGTPIHAISDGTIVQIRKNDPSYGQDILLRFRPPKAWLQHLARGGDKDDDGVLFALYAHLSNISVTEGQKVKGGQMIGATGISGNADQKYPHLHFEIRKIRYPGSGAAGLANRIDPEKIYRNIDFSEPYDFATSRMNIA